MKMIVLIQPSTPIQRLYQFKGLLFGLTNEVAAFQWTMDKFISQNELCETFAYLDDIIVCGSNEVEYDQNLDQFENIVLTLNMTFIFKNANSNKRQYLI